MHELFNFRQVLPWIKYFDNVVDLHAAWLWQLYCVYICLCHPILCLVLFTQLHFLLFSQLVSVPDNSTVLTNALFCGIIIGNLFYVQVESD